MPHGVSLLVFSLFGVELVLVYPKKIPFTQVISEITGALFAAPTCSEIHQSWSPLSWW